MNFIKLSTNLSKIISKKAENPIDFKTNQIVRSKNIKWLKTKLKPYKLTSEMKNNEQTFLPSILKHSCKIKFNNLSKSLIY